MMKRNRIIILAAALASAVSFLSCTGELVIEQEPTIKEAAVKGELLVKFTPEVAEILETALPTKAGIPSVDEIFEIAGAYEFERVFPLDSRHEERTREAGLHLWYVVRFDASNDIEEVGRRLASLGEVSGVEYNHTIKRAYNPAKRAIPYDITSLPSTKATPVYDDPLLGLQWNIINDGKLWNRGFRQGADVNVKDAWKMSTGDSDIIVAVVDEGVMYDHPDLAASMWRNEGEIFADVNDNDGNGYAGDLYGYNFVKETGQVTYSLSADTGHGSHVAGVIAAQNNNGIGISSIAGGDGLKPGVKIMSCQIFSGNYVASILAEVRAIKYAADNGAVILQCSWGYVSSKANPYDWAPQYATDEEWLTQNPVEKDALFYFEHMAGSPNGPIEGGIGVFASGNESAAAAGYPGAYGDFVSVIGTAPDFTPAVYTNYGTGANICAPGGDQDYFYDFEENGEYGTIGCILSTVPYHISPSGYAYMEGSSMATPHVSASLALAISYAKQMHRHLTADEYKELLYSTATSVEPYLVGSKIYYKYVADLEQNHKKKMDLETFRGKMGAGQVNTTALLKAVAGAGRPMVFPNVYVSVGETLDFDASDFFDNCSVIIIREIGDESVVKIEKRGTILSFTGLKEGVTTARIIAGSDEQTVNITVRNSAGDAWL